MSDYIPVLIALGTLLFLLILLLVPGIILELGPLYLECNP